jgi:hypothetical protein
MKVRFTSEALSHIAGIRSYIEARSAYSKPGGASPKCYVTDVSPAEIAAYCKAH